MTYHTTEELLGRRSEWAVSPNNFNGLIDSHLLANQRIAELEAQLKGWNKAFQSTNPAIAAERMQNAIDMAKFVGYEDARARYDAQLKAAREALKELYELANHQRILTFRHKQRILAALDGEKKGDIDERN